MSKSKLFYTAWALLPYCRDFSEALTRAWKLMRLRARMAKEVVSFTYSKVDGTIRHATGTLNVPYEAKGAKPVRSVLNYYDVDKQGWRCAKVERVLV